MANTNFKLDITGWEQKVKNVIEVQARVVKDILDWGLDQVKVAAVKNVSGPRYSLKQRQEPEVKAYISSQVKAGKLPVNIMFSFLRNSIRVIRISTVFGAVISDNSKANYNRYVHFGYKKTIKSGNKMKTIVIPPRPFLQAAVDERRPAILNRMKYEILKEINKAGRA